MSAHLMPPAGASGGHLRLMDLCDPAWQREEKRGWPRQGPAMTVWF